MAIGPKALESRDPPVRDYTEAGANDERRRAAQQSMEADRLRAVEATVLGTPDGRAWLWSILLATGVMGEELVLENSYQNGFQNGQRSVGSRLLRRLARSSPEGFAAMLHEQDSQ